MPIAIQFFQTEGFTGDVISYSNTAYPPDLTPMFFLWRYIKDKFYHLKLSIFDYLWEEIKRQSIAVPNEMIHNVVLW